MMKLSDLSITIRPAGDRDIAGLVSLAALDSSAPLRGRTLVAEADGELKAALSLEDGRAVADPFFSSARLVDMLELEAARRAVDAVAQRNGLRSWLHLRPLRIAP